MGRRKPLVVQRKRPRAAAPDTTGSDSDASSSGCGASNDSRDAADRGEDEEHDDHVNKRRRSSDGHTLVAGRARVPLTFRNAWTPERRADALWLRWTLPPAEHAALAAALRLLRGDAGGDGADVVVGVEVIEDSGLVTLRVGGDDGATAPTHLTLDGLFPGTSSEWHAQLLALVEDELLLLEVVTHPRDGDDARGRAAAFELRAGVAWRAYAELPRTAEFPRAHQSRSSQRRMQQAMLWLLAKATSGQCEYAYWREIAALYQSSFVDAGDDDDAPEDEAFDIHDVYARIDVQRQLRRDTSSFDRSGASRSLVPSLRPYQTAAVSWMLARETREQLPRAEVSTLVRFSGRDVGYDPFRARFIALPAAAVDESDEFAGVADLADMRGGILADEMGLGKTVEVIALVLSHPWGGARPSLLSQHEPLSSPTADAGATRGCVCGSDADDERGWTQCAFCSRWHHRLCTGRSESVESAGDADAFMCFHCQPVHKPLRSCRTTLIVSPEAIVGQWEAELQRHVAPALKVLVYPGVSAVRRRLERLKQPSEDWRLLADAGVFLAEFDVVLTTYEALGADLRHLPNDATRERRASTRQKRKPYAHLTSPLPFLRFWRVCVDEAQLGVENPQLQTALTVAELRAENKWVVTGTPVSTQLGDLFGCLKFLGLAPFDDADVGAAAFDHVVQRTFRRGAPDRLLDLLLWDGRSGGERHTGGGLLWRTSKRDVRQQLGLLEQQTEVVWCRFSDVERHYYDEEEKAIVRQVKTFQREHPSAAAAGVTDAIWQELLVLRQICCHPQVGSSARSAGAALSLRGRAGAGSVLSMDAFLQELVAKCRRECEEAQRKLIAAHNALAALHEINGERPTAVLKYLVSIRTIRSHWPLFRADLLPRLHILENLARCARGVFGIGGDGAGAEAQDAAADNAGPVVHRELLAGGDTASNPKLHALLPELPALARTVTLDASEEAMRERADVDAIARECEQLDACAQQIKRFYLVQVETSHLAALSTFEAVAAKVEDEVARAKRPVLCDPSLWWLAALEALERHDPELADHFADRLHLRLLEFSTPWAVRFCHQFTTIAGFRLAFLSELEELAKKRATLYAKLRRLSAEPPTKRDVERSGNCGQCREGRDGPTCAHCKLYTELETFKRHFQGVDSNAPKKLERLFVVPRVVDGTSTTDTIDIPNTVDNGDGAAGSSASASFSLILEIFREIVSATRAAAAAAAGDPSAPAPADGLRAEVEFWHQVQREWTAAKKLFQAQHQRLGALDELEMATLQIRVRLAGEHVTKAEKEYKILPTELPSRLLKFESERIVSDLELHEKMARLRFLSQLGDQQPPASQPSAAAVPAPRAASESLCAVCLEAMANERVMLPCAHVFCKTCIQKLMKQHAARGGVRCPTCRVACPAAKVAVVFEDAASANARRAATKRGSHSTRPVADAHVTPRCSGFGSKMDAVARRVLALAQRNARVKCLLFTQWHDMLSIVASHLRANGVSCVAYESKKQFPAAVQQFRASLEPCVLALPFKVGANGLNLTEATEVLLVEPLLNPSIEAQAINRVHRIGQTRQTRVHRFVVDNSVEERIYWLGQKRSARRRHDTGAGAGAGAGADGEAEEDVNKENAGGRSNGGDTVERAPSKKEKEQLSLGELHVLLDGKLEGRSGGGDTDDNDADHVLGETESELHPFWQERVVLDGRSVERLDAKQVLERREAAERRERAEQPPPPPLTHLFDLELNVVVADAVAALAHASALEQTNAISAELLAFHRARLQEELGVWQRESDV